MLVRHALRDVTRRVQPGSGTVLHLSRPGHAAGPPAGGAADAHGCKTAAPGGQGRDLRVVSQKSVVSPGYAQPALRILTRSGRARSDGLSVTCHNLNILTSWGGARPISMVVPKSPRFTGIGQVLNKPLGWQLAHQLHPPLARGRSNTLSARWARPHARRPCAGGRRARSRA